MGQFMIGVNPEMFDTGGVDGASKYRLFFSIVLSLVKPTLSALTILFSM